MIDLTPSGYFNFNFFAQRVAIPKAINYQLDEAKGQLGDAIEISENSMTGYVREIDFGVYMDRNTLESLRELIDEKLKEHNETFES